MINLNKVKYLQRLNNSYGYVKFIMQKIPRIFKEQKSKANNGTQFF